MTVRYAAYGSNLHPMRIGRRLGSAAFRGTAFLPDWSLCFHKLSKDGSGKCSIREGSSGVHLAIYDISDTDRLVLDQIEGLGAGYDEVSLDVPGFGRCFSYTAADTHIDESLVPYDWYRELVLAGASMHDFPEAYVDRIRSVTAGPDPDAGRHRQMWDLIHAFGARGKQLT